MMISSRPMVCRPEVPHFFLKGRAHIHVTCAIFDEKPYLHVHAFHMGLVRIFGDFDARCRRKEIVPVYFKWTFDVDITTQRCAIDPTCTNIGRLERT